MQKPNSNELTPEQFAKLGVGDKLRKIKDYFDNSTIKAPLTTDRERMREMLREKLGTEKILALKKSCGTVNQIL